MREFNCDYGRSSKKSLKAGIDMIVDPLLFWATSNAAGAYGGDKLLDYISKSTDTYEGLAMMGVYAGIGVTAFAANKWIILPIAKKIGRYHKVSYSNGEKRGLFSWARSLAQPIAMYTLYFQLNISNVAQNLEFDASRVIDAFSRSGESARLLAKKEEAYTFAEIPQYSLGSDKKPLVTGMIEGKKIDGMFSLYTGISGTAPKNINVDFRAQLEKMWSAKLKLTDDNTTKEVYNTQVNSYKEKNAKWTRMTFTTYLTSIGNSIKAVKNNINWQIAADKKDLNQSETKLLRDISSLINERDLIAYGMTELMPGNNGDINIGVTDFLLRNAGREYIELIPALGDALPSYGLYQFTPYALFDDEKKTDEERGASIINLALPEDLRITTSMRSLKGNDHHKAAYLFAINNLAELIKQLNRRQFSTLQQKYSYKMIDIANYIATAHHQPANAISSANLWLDDRAESTYSSNCNEKIRIYSRKTAGNLVALYKGLDN